METDLIKHFEKRITDLESKMGNNPKKERKPRKPSEYNTFMSEYIAKNKDPKKKHSELFTEGAKAWSLKKK